MKTYNFFTHGGKKAKAFDWKTESDVVVIENENGREHHFTITETHTVLRNLHNHFGDDWFPLANQVDRMADGNEKPGLGSFIYALSGSTTHGQGASYLGVILEVAGILEWNGKARGIAWRFHKNIPNRAELMRMLS